MTVLKAPASLIKFTSKLFSSNEEREQFLSAFAREPNKESVAIYLKEPTSVEENKNWNSGSDFFPSWVQAPGTSEAHDSGEFYLLDPSSVFSAIPLLQLPKSNLVFDACAAPGGKSIFAWRAHQPNLLIANEPVEKRLRPLISNLQRCKIRPAEVFHLYPKKIGEMFPGCFPLVLVDAPCSGQSLLLKGERVDGAFHPQTINGNAMRQRRILAELAPSVAPDGHILYMTCTFSREENEDIIEWFIKKFPAFEVQSVPALESYHSKFSEFPSYRLWPHQNHGAGSFTALLRNSEGGTTSSLPKNYKPVWQNS